MAANKERLRAAGLELEVEIKQYSTLPYIHGFSVSGAFGVHYVSFCRWLPTEPQPEDGEYEWGENCYHRITDDTPDHAAKDLSLIFDGCFKYLWATSGDTVWSFNIP